MWPGWKWCRENGAGEHSRSRRISFWLLSAWPSELSWKERTIDSTLAGFIIVDINKKARSDEDRAYMNKPGDFLLSHTLARAVPSGLRGLTAVFGMGTGGSLSLWSPRSRGAGALAHWRAEYFDGWPFPFEGERPETHSESSAVLCAQ